MSFKRLPRDQKRTQSRAFPIWAKLGSALLLAFSFGAITGLAYEQPVPEPDRIAALERSSPPSDLARRAAPKRIEWSGRPVDTVEEAPSEARGLDLYRPGVKKIRIGLVVPSGFPLPKGYLRHQQVTDDGVLLEPILMFDAAHPPKDERGHSIPVPADRIVPPEHAPEGLPIPPARAARRSIGYAGRAVTPDEVNRFSGDGFIAVREAIDIEVLRACRAVIDAALRDRGIDLDDAATWTVPVARFDCPEGQVFAAAGLSPKLCASYDALLGAGNWVRREGVGGTIAVRFPSDSDPGDAGWHIDGSFEVDGSWHVNLSSRQRALLSLFLFSDIGIDDAPTQLLVGSHLDVPRTLIEFGDRGVPFTRVARMLPASTFERPIVRATGRAGDVIVCHPFLVHRASWPHRGRGPRIIAQPEIAHAVPFALSDAMNASVVERAIIGALGV